MIFVKATYFILVSSAFSPRQSCEARPEVLQEQNLSYHRAFLKGMHVGFESLLALAGFDEEDSVKESLRSDTLIIDEEDEENQTEIKVVGLGLGRTGTTSVVMALELLGYQVVHDDEHTELTDLYAYWEEDVIDSDEFHRILGLRGYNATFKTVNAKWAKRHPEVKAILTVRDNPDKYVDSWLAAAPFIDILGKAPFSYFETVDELMPSLEVEYLEEATGGNPEDYLNREVLRATYITYVEQVREMT